MAIDAIVYGSRASAILTVRTHKLNRTWATSVHVHWEMSLTSTGKRCIFVALVFDEFPFEARFFLAPSVCPSHTILNLDN